MLPRRLPSRRLYIDPAVNEFVFLYELLQIPFYVLCGDIEDRGYQFGDGVYEVIRVYNGALFGLREHIVRLFRSAAEIGITLPFSAEDIEWDLQKLVQENKLIDGGVYIRI